MPDRIVRVRANGHEFNIGAAAAKRHGHEVLDESPYDRSGSLKPTTRRKGRPTKRRVSIDELAEKKAAPSADQSDNDASSKE